MLWFPSPSCCCREKPTPTIPGGNGPKRKPFPGGKPLPTMGCLTFTGCWFRKGGTGNGLGNFGAEEDCPLFLLVFSGFIRAGDAGPVAGNGAQPVRGERTGDPGRASGGTAFTGRGT